MNLQGSTLDIYEIGDELGRGGMGAVYRAVSTADGPAGPAGTTVAIKTIHAELVSDEKSFQRFEREGQIGQELNHPNVVRTYAAGSATLGDETCHYMVLQLIEGQTLGDLQEELGVVPDHLLYLIADQALAGLQAIHEQGVVHRDIKPENIVITTSHEVLIMDLGVARISAQGHTLTESGEFVGSLHYAAPEQLDAQAEILPPCDLYSFGAVLYELATGKRAFDADDLATLFGMKLSGDLTRPRELQAELDPFLDEVITTCLQKAPTERFGAAEELRSILSDGVQSAWWQTHSQTRETSGAERALKRLRLNREVGLIGRDVEIDELGMAYSRAADGHGQAVLIRGGSGMGKSRLIYDFIEELSVSGGPRVAAGRSMGQGGRAYQAFIEVAHDVLDIDDDASPERREELEHKLTELLPDRPGVVAPLAKFLLADLGEGAAALPKEAILAAFDTVLRRGSEDQPLVIVLEDLHLSGTDSLDMLEYALRNLSESKVLILAAYDQDQVEDGSRLHEVLATSEAREGVETLALEPLSRPECDVLVRSVIVHQPTIHELADLLYRRSDGNPLLVLEVIAQWKATGVLEETEEGLVLQRQFGLFEVPSQVAQLIHFKLASLDEDLRETLDTAAVIGHEFQASVLAKMLEERRIKLLKRLALLERKYHLIQSSGKDTFRFANRQIDEVLYQGISPDLRAEYHSLAADTLLEVHEDEERLPAGVAFQVVRHLIAGERQDEVEEYAVAASIFAVGRYHATYVAIFLERVAKAIEGAAPAVRFDVSKRRWDVYGALGRRADQVEVLERAHALAEEADDAGRQAQAVCLQAVTDWGTGKFEPARAKARNALELAREAGDREWEANALHSLGAVERQQGEFESCAKHWRQALEIRREIGDRHGEARSLASLGTVMPELGESEDALDAKEQALAIFRELGDQRGECAMLNNIGNTLVDHRRIEEATERFQQAITIAQRLGSLAAEGHPTCNLGRAYAALGYAVESRDCLTNALRIFKQARVQSGVIDALRSLADAHVTFGDLAEARAALEVGLELAERSGARPVQCEFESSMGNVLHELGDAEGAQAAYDRALAHAEAIGSPKLRINALTARGTHAIRSGAPADARAPMEEALALAEQAGLEPAEQALLRARLVWALAADGAVEEAREGARALIAVVGEPGALVPGSGPELGYILGSVLGDEGQGYLERAQRLVQERADEIQDPYARDHYLETEWPARDLVSPR